MRSVKVNRVLQGSGSVGGSGRRAILFGGALSQLESKRLVAAGLGRFHGMSPLTCDLKSLVWRPVRETGIGVVIAGTGEEVVSAGSSAAWIHAQGVLTMR